MKPEFWSAKNRDPRIFKTLWRGAMASCQNRCRLRDWYNGPLALWTEDE